MDNKEPFCSQESGSMI